MTLDTILEQLASDSNADFDLAEVALHLAVDEYPGLDVEACLAEIAALSREARGYVRGPFSARVDGLCRYLFHELGFRGNKKDYYDPRNSYFNQVLDRRTGIPITLATVMMALGRRTGVEIRGVGLPGHFIVCCVDGNQEILVDPFHGGRRLSLVDCENLVRQTTGQELTMTSPNQHVVPSGRILFRMLANLRGIYMVKKDWSRALRVLGRMNQLVPNESGTRRDLGICLVESGEPGRAIDFLREYLTLQPDTADQDKVAAYLQQALREVARWN